MMVKSAAKHSMNPELVAAKGISTVAHSLYERGNRIGMHRH